MAGSYLIVRYVIVKPVKHLKDVSDAIAAGRAEHPQRDPDRRRVRGPVARVQPDAPQPRRHAGPQQEVNADLDRKVDELAQVNMALFEIEPAQERLPRHHEPRTAHAAQQHHRLLRGAARAPTT